MTLKASIKTLSILLSVLCCYDGHSSNNTWLVGGSVGYGQSIGHINAATTAGGKRFASFRSSSSAVLGELMVGYGTSINSVYWGVEASGMLDSTDSKQALIAPQTDANAPSEIFVKHPGQIGLSGILAYNMSSASKVFLGLGVYWNIWKLTYKGEAPNDNYYQYSFRSKSAFVLTPSIGLETSICKDSPWFIRSTFRYNLPVKINFSTQRFGNTALLFANADIKATLSQCQFLISLIYRFGPKAS